MSDIADTSNPVTMEVTDVKIIQMTIESSKPLIKVSEEQKNKLFKISQKTIQWIQQILQIISQRNTFKIDEFKIVGIFYESLQSITDESISGDSLQGLLNILQTCSQRGVFQINEFEIIADLYSSIRKVLE